MQKKIASCQQCRAFYVELLTVFSCVCPLSDCGGIRAKGKRSGWSAESAPPQYGRQPERPLPAALLHYTKGPGLQGTRNVSIIVTVVI